MAAAIVAAAAVGAAVWAGTRPSVPQVSRFAVSTTAANALSIDPQSRDLTMTANGTHIVYKGGIGGPSTQLFVRGLGQLDPAPLTAPGLPKGPFSSPDGQWIGFFVPGRPVTLKKVAITGGPVRRPVWCRWSEPRRHVGRGRHDHSRDRLAVYWPAACVVGWR